MKHAGIVGLVAGCALLRGHGGRRRSRRWSSAAARLRTGVAEADKPKVAIANDAEAAYCTPAFKPVLERVLHACGLVGAESRRGCQPADVKTLAPISDDDFNALFTPLKSRGAVIMFDDGSEKLDDGGQEAHRGAVARPPRRPLLLRRRARVEDRARPTSTARSRTSARTRCSSCSPTSSRTRTSTRRSACSGSATSSRSSARSTAIGTCRATGRSARPRRSTGARSCLGRLPALSHAGHAGHAGHAARGRARARGCDEGKSDLAPPPPVTGRSNAVAAKETATATAPPVATATAPQGRAPGSASGRRRARRAEGGAEDAPPPRARRRRPRPCRSAWASGCG